MKVEDRLNSWEKQSPPKCFPTYELDAALVITEFLEIINLPHLTDFFVDSMEMEKVSEFRCLSQKRQYKIKSQLSSLDLKVLNALLQGIGIFIRNFSDKTEIDGPVQTKMNKHNVNDEPS